MRNPNKRLSAIAHRSTLCSFGALIRKVRYRSKRVTNVTFSLLFDSIWSKYFARFSSLSHISDVWWSTLWSIASISIKNIKTNCWTVNNKMISLHSACGLWFDLWTQRVVEIKGQWPNRWHCDISRWSAPHLQIAEPDFKSHAYSHAYFELLLDKVASTDSGGNQSEHRQPRMANS